MRGRRKWLAAGLVAAGCLLAGCGLAVTAARSAAVRPGRVERLAKPRRPRRSAARADHRPMAASQPSTHEATKWPPLVVRALQQLPASTAAPRWGPTVLPRGNSAVVAAAARSFQVSVFRCPVPEPIDSPLVGQQACGSMESVAESFGATEYPSAAAAHAALPGAGVSVPPGGESVAYPLPGGLVAQRVVAVSSAGAALTVEVLWHEGDWAVSVSGGVGQRAAATMIARLLQQYRLPPDPGVLAVTVAPDGQHTTITWATGDEVLHVSSYHQAAHAIAMAASMHPFGQAS